MRASWKKSTTEDGKWVVRVVATDPFEELPDAGTSIGVTRRDGEVKTVTLGKQLWSGEGDGKFEDDNGKPVALYAVD